MALWPAAARRPPDPSRFLPPPLNSVWFRRLLQLLAVLRFFRVPQLAYSLGLRASSAVKLTLRVWRAVHGVAPWRRSKP